MQPTTSRHRNSGAHREFGPASVFGNRAKSHDFFAVRLTERFSPTTRSSAEESTQAGRHRQLRRRSQQSSSHVHQRQHVATRIAQPRTTAFCRITAVCRDHADESVQLLSSPWDFISSTFKSAGRAGQRNQVTPNSPSRLAGSQPRRRCCGDRHHIRSSCLIRCSRTGAISSTCGSQDGPPQGAQHSPRRRHVCVQCQPDSWCHRDVAQLVDRRRFWMAAFSSSGAN